MACLSLRLCFRSLSPQIPVSISSSSSSSSSFSSKRAATSRSSIRAKAIDPNDSFLSKLSSRDASNPDLIPTSNSEIPPLVDHMAMPSEVERSSSYDRHGPRGPPPDVASEIFDRRTIWIDQLLVPPITELVVAQLLYLNMMDPQLPIYMFINSTGTTDHDGKPVAMESEGFSIYNTMMHIENEIHTLCCGMAIGQACLLLAAGTKGKRYMSSYSIARIHQPCVPSSGWLSTNDVLVRTEEVMTDRDTLVKLLAKHTGNSVETVSKAMQSKISMGALEAQKFGLIDKIGDEIESNKES